MLALTLALLWSGVPTNGTLASERVEEALDTLNRFSRSKYRVVSKIMLLGGLRHISNTNGQVLAATDNGIFAVNKHSLVRLKTPAFPREMVGVQYLVRSPKTGIAVWGDGEYECFVQGANGWIPVKGTAYAFFRSSGELVFVSDYMENLKTLPRGLPVKASITKKREVRAGKYQIEEVGSHGDKTVLRVQSAYATMSFTLPFRSELDWPAFGVSPTRDGGVILQVNARVPYMFRGCVFDLKKRKSIEIPTSKMGTGWIVDAWSATDSTFICQTARNGAFKSRLATSDGRRVMEWKHSWLPIWQPPDRVVFYRPIDGKMEVAVASNRR